MRVLIADDHPLMRVALRRTLEAEGGFEVVSEAGIGGEVLALVDRKAPEVVLLDLQMPASDGLGLLARIADRHPQVKVIVLSESSDPDLIQAAFKRGARGYVVKTIDTVDLGSAIRQAVERTAFHASGLPALNEESAAKAAGLTDRELAMVKGVVRGLSNQAIGKELWVTEQTVKFHLTNIFRKLGVRNRVEVARWAYARGLTNDLEEDLQESARDAGRRAAAADERSA